MRVVLDANIFIAAFLAKGLSSDILKFGESGKIQICTSSDILKEVYKKLTTKSKLDKTYVRGLVSLIEGFTTVVTPIQKLDVVKADPDDNKIVECAVEAEADLIVTMDKHLLKLKSYGKTGIIHPKTLTWVLPKILES